MATATRSFAGFDKQALERPLTVVSCDGHIGPRLEQDLRPYCPRAYLDRFDEYARGATAFRATGSMFSNLSAGEHAKRLQRAIENIRSTAGHYDLSARLKDMDKDGVCAEVIYPGSQNGETEPFVGSDLGLNPATGDLELFQVGMRIYAEWLADFCRQAPDRLIGLVTPPLWDIDKSIETVKWAHKAGLKGIYLLSPRAGVLRYDRPEWEPFWSVCEDLGMNLNTHSGGPLEDMITGAGGAAVAAFEIELGGWPARKAAHQLIFSGVFERHPKLKIVFTEQNFDWWTQTSREFDSVYFNHQSVLEGHMRRKPSEYMATNVLIGASFMAPFEARDAVANGYTDNVIWGRDYGHIEGTFVVTEDDDPMTNPGRMSMRYCFSDTPPEAIRKMVSDNGLDFYHLDAAALAKVAQTIGSPSLAELTTPIQAVPENGGILAFRHVGAWW